MANITKIFFLVLLFTAVACNTGEKSKGLISEEKMTAILVDIHFFEARYEQQAINPDSLARIVKKNYQYILQDHGVTEEAFYRTFDYYEQNPDEFDELYQHVVDELSRMEAELQGERSDTAEESPQ